MGALPATPDFMLASAERATPVALRSDDGRPTLRVYARNGYNYASSPQYRHVKAGALVACGQRNVPALSLGGKDQERKRLRSHVSAPLSLFGIEAGDR